MRASESLAAGASIKSPSGRYRLILQSDGNAVLYDDFGFSTLLKSSGLADWAADIGIANSPLPAALWDSRTVGSSASSLVMDPDGSLVLLAGVDSSATPVWHTRTAGWPGAFMSVRDDGTVAVNRADGRVLWIVGTSTPDVGLGGVRHIVYGRSAQRIWLVEADGALYDTYPVSGKATSPAPGRHSVFSKSAKSRSVDGSLTMEHMVRFTVGNRGIAIGFHAIPRDSSGAPAQSVDELGQFLSGGCVRQQDSKAHQLYDWAPLGTPVVVVE